MVKKVKGFTGVTKVTGEKIKRIKIWKIREFGGLTWRQRRRSIRRTRNRRRSGCRNELGTVDDSGRLRRISLTYAVIPIGARPYRETSRW